jgi:hypothetical protein
VERGAVRAGTVAGGSGVEVGGISVDFAVAASDEWGAGLSRTQADITSAVATTTRIAIHFNRAGPAGLMIE